VTSSPVVDTPGQLADMAAYAPDLELEQRVELLEAIDVEARLELALSWARRRWRRWSSRTASATK